MTHDETVKALTLVKGNWMRQPTDDLTIKVWAHIFKDADYRDVMAAVMSIIQTTQNQERVPTAGEILHISRLENISRIRAENASRLRIGARAAPISPEAVEKVKAGLKALREELTAKLRMKNR